MFGRRKGAKDSAKKAGHETAANDLSWASDDAVEAVEADAERDDELDDEIDDDPDEEVDAAFGEDDAEDDEGEVEIAERQLELQRELERQAEEFGLANQSATAVYGANGDAVADALDRLEAIDIETAEQLADAWLAIDPKERDLVEREFGRSQRRGDRYYELAAAETAVTTWLSTRMQAEPDDADLWQLVAEAARGAVDALIADQELDDADYETLYGAWAEVMDAEEPEEDEPAPAPAKGAASTKAAAGKTGKGAAPAPAAAAKPVGKGAKAAGKAAKSDESPIEDEFGPNTELVRRFFVKLGELGRENLQDLIAAWKDQDRHDLKQAHEEVRRLAKEDATWREQVRAAQEIVTTWAERVGGGVDVNSEHAVLGGASAIAVTAATMAGSSAGHKKTLEMEQLLQAKHDAVPSAVDAVTALVLADLLEVEDAETLFAPWADAIGEPDLPEFESEE